MKKKSFIGTVSGSADYHDWKDGIVYWDLYNSVHYEIVLETYCDFMSYPTEKLYKPIVAKIPFIVLSDYKFYNYIHSLGFKTFGNIIDESFAYEPDLKIRVNKMVQSIANIDPNEFFVKSRDICEHNYKNLCHLHFKYGNENGNEMSRQLDSFLCQIYK